MEIRVIKKEDEIKTYYQLLHKAITEEAQFFRLTPTDIIGEVFPTGDTFESFTLGAFAENGDLIGTVGFKRESFLKLRHKGLIFRMYVAPQAKGLGLGRKLLQAAIERARQGEGLKQIVLTLIADNHRAKSLYLSEGFEVFSFEKQAIRMSEELFVDENAMVKYL